MSSTANDIRQKSIRVLLVEASPIHQEMMAQLLSLYPNIAIMSATDSLNALELARQSEPDAILMDFTLPGMTGAELIHCCRKSGIHSRILVQIDSFSPQDRMTAFLAGADMILVKPVSIQQVFFHIYMVCGGVRERCEAIVRKMDANEKRSRRLLVQAVETMVLYPDWSLKQIYMELAEKENTSKSCVEKNIRDSIDAFHKRYSRTYQNLTGVAQDGRRPSNGKFLRLLVEAAKNPEKSE